MASTEEREDTLTVGSAACGPRGGAGAARAAHLSWSSFRLGAAGRGRGAPRRRLRRRDNQPHRDAASTRSPAEEAGTAPAPPRPLPRGPMGPAPAAPPRGPAPSAPPAWRGRDPRPRPSQRPLRGPQFGKAAAYPRPPALGLPQPASASSVLRPPRVQSHDPSFQPRLAPHPGRSCCTRLRAPFLGLRLGGSRTTSLPATSSLRLRLYIHASP